MALALDPTSPPQPKQGWLHKRGDVGLKSWTKRFFTLDGTGIGYYLDENQKTQRGTIPLHSIVCATSSTPPASYLLLSSAGGYFQVNTNESKSGRIYYLYCDSKEETTHWIIAINYWRDYASASGFGPKTGNEVASVSAAPPQPYTPYQNPSVPSAPPMESPYDRYLEYERQSNNNEHTQISSPPPYAPGYANPPPHMSPSIPPAHISPSLPHTHLAPNFPPPYAPSTISVPVPPQPPRPLRTIDESGCREIMFSEGSNLKNYMDLTVSCCSFLMHQDLRIGGGNNQKRMHVLCAYLVISSLDWDNRNTPPTPYWCSPAYADDNIFQYFAYLIALSRQEILDNWPMEGPTVVTQIDTWIKRKRKDHQQLIHREDRDAFLKRNLAVLSYIRAGRLFDENSATLDACLVLIDRIIEAEEQVSHNRYGIMVWKAVESNLQDKDKPQAYPLIWAYLTYQKLKLENDQLGFMARDPFVTNAFTTVLTMFHNAINGPAITNIKHNLQPVMMKIFATWQRDLPLLNPAFKNDFSHLILSNIRIVSRLMAKLLSYPPLYEAFQKLKVVLEQRLGQEAVPVNSITPFPSLPQPYNPNSEDMSELGYVIRQALANLHN